MRSSPAITATATRSLAGVPTSLLRRCSCSLHEVSRPADAAGVTKGVLYHHFRGGKRQLFHTVAAQVHGEVAEQVATAAPHADPREQLLAGCRAFLEATLDPAVQQILLLDAPAVLGWDLWREMDAASSMRHLDAALEQLMADGTIDRLPLRPLVHLLSGAMNEAVLAVVHSPDPQRELACTITALERLLTGLFGSTSTPQPTTT